MTGLKVTRRGRPELESYTPVNIENGLYRDNGEGVAATPLPYPLESCPGRLRIQPLWKLQTMGLAVPSPVGRERVRVRVKLFELRLLFGPCFCTNPKYPIHIHDDINPRRRVRGLGLQVL